MEKTKDSEIDFEIIRQIKDGDSSAFRKLVDRHKDKSFSLACSILQNEHDAEDVLQECFIKAFKGLKSFRFQSTFATWFYKILINTCNTELTHRQRIHKLYTDEKSSLEIANNDTGHNTILNKELGSIINNCIDSLSTNEALLLRLFYISELSLNEIKELTGFKDSKIRVTLHRARKHFQEVYEARYNG
ncbi:MAG: RNA polymerase sigma factor [Bacteroidales bacterium]